MSLKILAVGPKSPPITGQSIAFQSYTDNSELNIEVFNTSPRSSKKFIQLVHRVSFLFIYIYLVFKNKYNILYITTSRTTHGFIFDFLYIYIFKILSNGKVVNHLHGADFVSFRKNSKLKFLIDYVYNKIDISIVLTKKMVRQYSYYKKMKVYVVNNFSNIQMSHNESLTKMEKSLINNKITLLYLSNIMYSKGIIHLLDAIQELKPEYRDKFNLKIAGDFISDEYLDKNNIEKIFFKKIKEIENIEYLGVLSGNEKIEILHSSEVFILPTFYKTEAQPISIIEAMSNLCLIIATDHNYNLELINNDTAVILSTNKLKSEIKNALAYISKEKNRDILLKKCIVSYNLAKNEYSEFKYISSIDRIIMDAL